jgi:hypothetical protein
VDGTGQRIGILIAGSQDVEGEPLRALAANAGQLFQFVDQPAHGLGKFGHKKIGNLVICNLVIL